MAAYSEPQDRDSASETAGCSATRHKREVGTGYFDKVTEVISGGTASTLARVGRSSRSSFSSKPEDRGATKRLAAASSCAIGIDGQRDAGYFFFAMKLSDDEQGYAL